MLTAHAILVHSRAGLTDDHFLAYAFTGMCILRVTDGPDEVDAETIPKPDLHTYEYFTSPQQRKNYNNMAHLYNRKC